MIIIYAFLLPISRASAVFFSLLFIMFWLYQLYINRDFSIFEERFIQFFLLFIAITFISLIWTTQVDIGLDLSRKLLYMFAFIAIMNLFDKRYINHVLIAFLFGLLVNELVAYGIFFKLFTYKNVTSDNPTPFMHHIVYSIFLLFGIIISFYKFLHFRKI